MQGTREKTIRRPIGDMQIRWTCVIESSPGLTRISSSQQGIEDVFFSENDDVVPGLVSGES